MAFRLIRSLFALALLLTSQASFAQTKRTPAKSKAPATESKVIAHAPPSFTFHGLYVNIGSPELVSIGYFGRLSRYFGLQVFTSPAISYESTVKVPSQKIKLTGMEDLYGDNIEIHTNPAELDFRFEYGPQVGLAAVFFPFESPWFFSLGGSYRRLYGYAKSRVTTQACYRTTSGCTKTYVDEEGGSEMEIPEILEGIALDVKAEVESISWNIRMASGYTWRSKSGWLLNLEFIGLMIPRVTKREAVVLSELDVGADFFNVLVNTSFQDILLKEETAAESQITKKIKDYDERLLPVFGLSVGLHF